MVRARGKQGIGEAVGRGDQAASDGGAAAAGTEEAPLTATGPQADSLI